MPVAKSPKKSSPKKPSPKKPIKKPVQQKLTKKPAPKAKPIRIKIKPMTYKTKSLRKPLGKKIQSRKKPQKKRLKVLEHVQFHYVKTKDYFDIKLPRASIRLGIIILAVIVIASIAMWPEPSRSLELQQTDQCNLDGIPQESMKLYHRFGIQNTTTFKDFNKTFVKLSDDIPGLTAYYGPGFGLDNPKNGVGIHFSSTSAAGFILIWDEPFFTSYQETEEGVVAGPGNYHSKLSAIWIFNEVNEKVCTVTL